MHILFGEYYNLFRIVWVLVREGVISSLSFDQLPYKLVFFQKISSFFARGKSRNYRHSHRLARAMERLGPSYVKMGQFLATRPDIIGAKLSEDLSLLQDRMGFFSTDIAKLLVSSSLNRQIEELYYDFSDPIAAASIAQLHPAIVNDVDGYRKVAVKVIRPGVRKQFFKDIKTMYFIARIQEKFIPSMNRMRLLEIVRTLEQVTKIEMDLRLEAAAFSEMADNITDDRGFRVPKIDWDRTGRDVVTMEWIDGIKISDIDKLRDVGHDLECLSVSLIQSFLLHALRDGFFHADMHPGNLFVDSKGCIVAVDMGITGRLCKKERNFLAEILYGFITRDYQRVADVHFEAGYVPHKHNTASFAQALRAIGEPIHGLSSETISMGKLLTMLFEITELFDMETRPELVLLQKNMVVVEGVARMLNPQFNMWASSEPIVEAWIRDRIGPKKRIIDLQDGIKSAIRLVQITPDFVDSIEKISTLLVQAPINENTSSCYKEPVTNYSYIFLKTLVMCGVIFTFIYNIIMR
ncbi:2-polyprenylphenol 6-hydroxylase [Candidatus Liberibacter americanus]|uniref:Ubiquinone biosynthesis monooxygenase UbiB n=1 Tax=Candidatus Liberibacter americanus str. Sao Paulo TaxID=1261131 RepID=U6B6G4_9HYPH|nr:2-polyprenylphenol 6-hydroxylase [Candidatus Liberibacter americanus]AHA28369.1 Ubiquinone biosynthesis monooxygenase UbiB [Candidatus Liberibacter americanus str. Sao Paulo]EMS36658.1 2-polyprenylphenol 6-hydroxylase [Candidatus Liberibacter americanus PW_SP]